MASLCPKCKSLMIDGRCTNKQCLSTILDIDHYMLETELKKQFRNINSIKNIYSNTYYDGHQQLFDEENIGDRYGFMAVDENWFKCLKERNMNIDVSCLSNNASDKDGFMLETIKEMTCTQVRRYAKSIRKYNILHTIRFGKGKTFNIVWGSNNGVRWDNISKICEGGYEKSQYADIPDLLMQPLDSLIKQWSSWSVSMRSHQDGILVKYFIHKERAYEIFRNREIKEGKKRRTALRHYVGEYAKEDGKIIEAYLRCDHKFEWNGMQCEIIPPIEVANNLK